ncbi:MAG: hypothetical protein KDD03_07615 [Gelidibacter sp.]|nr:hypothetical protein [Gelidibacter sp.]
MIKDFSHFIITRFNIKQSIWEKDKQGSFVNNEAWLKERYDLFERFCYPSMTLQTEQNFKWIVYFDKETPEFFKNKNALLAERFSNFLPKYVKDFNAFETNLEQDIQEYIEEKVTYVITTRLDNDDCFHKDAIKTIQRCFVKQDFAIIDLQNGLTLQIVNGLKLALRRDVISGPFISLIEKIVKNKRIFTVYDREHTNWQEDATFIDVTEGFYWMQIIHSRNIRNRLGSELIYNKNYLKGYEFIKETPFSFRYYVSFLANKIRFSKIINVFKIKKK